MVKFLIIRFSSIGDIVLTTPVVRCIKKQVENAEVHFLTKQQFVSILEPNPYIDKIHAFNNNFSELIPELRNENFDHIIDLHKNLRTFRVKRKLGLPILSFKKINIEKWLIVNFKKNILPNTHIVDRYLEPTRFFDVENDLKGLDYFIPQKDEIDISNFPDEFKKGYVAFVIGAKHATKRLTTNKIISLCQKINLPIILLGGKEDMEEGNVIVKNVGKNILNACGKYSINQSASLVKQSKLVITHDTGLMHIAAAFKKIIISIWGNTIPEFGMYPYFPDPQSKIFEVKNLKCRPCSKIGFQKCPKTHFRCMEEHNLEDIAKTAINLFH